MTKELSPLKKKMVDAGYDPEEVAVMSKQQFGVVTYWAGNRGGPIEIPSPSEVDEQWRMEGTKSDVDKLVTYWKVTKGGTAEDKVDMSDLHAAASGAEALPSDLHSPFVKKASKKK